jgi:phosphatidylglycerol---prolipoprotein diacylglyceryl transferase
MYMVALGLVYALLSLRLKQEKFGYSRDLIQSYFFWVILAILIGGRLGYVLFYNLKYFLANPWSIILPVDFSGGGVHFVGLSGMSYHGGLIAIILASVLFCRRHKISFWNFADFVVPAIPLGYMFGRIGNFINGELYGRITDAPWGMYFPLDPARELRHPSQLYEAFFEGLFLFLILWTLRKRKTFPGFFLGLYIMGYGLVRFFIEYTREPDPQLGLVWGPFTMGQILCHVMILGGALLLVIRSAAGRRGTKSTAAP